MKSFLRSSARPVIMSRTGFSSIPANLVKELREKSGAPMMECKKALAASEVNGDISKAMDWLRAKGKARAASGADRLASEGVIALFANATIGNHLTVVEVNSETDFVSRNKDFQQFVASVAKTTSQCFSNGPVPTPDLLVSNIIDQSPHSVPELPVKDRLADVINVIRENIVIRRAENMFSSQSAEISAGYVHGKVGIDTLAPNIQMGSSVAVVTLRSSTNDSAARNAIAEAGRKLAMHVVAAKPLYLTRDQVPPEVVAREQQIFSEQVASAEEAALALASKGGKGKPKDPALLQKVIAAKVEKRIAEITLLGQSHMAEQGSPIIAKHLASLSTQIQAPVELVSFLRWSLGETEIKS